MEEITIKKLYDLRRSVCGALLERYEYPWEALPHIGEMILTLGEALPAERYTYLGNQIWIAKTAVIAPSASLNGPLLVDEEAQIRPGAFLRGNAVVGKGAVVGNSTELKNCILFDAVEVPHFNYIGDSILGFHAHLGAGAVTSNVKSDRTQVVVRMQKDDGGSAEYRTGLKKLGAMLGDFAEVGCNSVLNPGTILGKNTTVYPLSPVRGFVPANHIYKKEGNIVKKRL